MAEVAFYFEYGCPWTALACTRLAETAMRTGAKIVWKPILIERVAAGDHSAAPPARARYAKKDLADWAVFCGVTIRHPGPFPVPAGWARRGAVIALEEALIAPYSERIFAACFGAVADIGSLDVAAECAAAVGLEPGGFSRRVQDPATQLILEDNSSELLARGGFGSPTMFVGDDMYFGNDRMPLVELALTRRAERPLVVPGAHGQQ